MKDKRHTQLLIAVGVGLVISDILPTPADAIYFHYERKNKQKLEEGNITPKQYWTRDALMYYGLNPLWWGSVLGISLLAGKTFEQRRNILISLIAGGVVIGVLHRNIKKDEEMYKLRKLEK